MLRFLGVDFTAKLEPGCAARRQTASRNRDSGVDRGDMLSGRFYLLQDVL